MAFDHLGFILTEDLQTEQRRAQDPGKQDSNKDPALITLLNYTTGNGNKQKLKQMKELTSLTPSIVESFTRIEKTNTALKA